MDFLKVSWVIEKQKKKRIHHGLPAQTDHPFLPMSMMETSQFKQVTLKTAATIFFNLPRHSYPCP